VELILFYVVLGLLAGFSAGLLGIGGGLVVVPGLAYLFSESHIPADAAMHMAIACSLTVMVFTGQASARAHYKRSKISVSLYKHLAFGIIPGTIGGVLLADSLHSDILGIIFGVLLIFIAFNILFKQSSEIQKPLPDAKHVGAFGVVVGILSGLLGIGGSAFTIPYLNARGIAFRSAVGMSALCSFTVAVIGSVSTMFTGLDEVGIPAWSTGYVYWPAVLSIAVPSMIMAPFGAQLAYKLPAPLLKRIFAVYLLFVSVHMLWR